MQSAFYFSFLFIAVFVLTSTPRTAGARFISVVLLFAGYAVEKMFIVSKEDVAEWRLYASRCRFVFSMLSGLWIAYEAITYRDALKETHNLTHDIARRQQEDHSYVVRLEESLHTVLTTIQQMNSHVTRLQSAVNELTAAHRRRVALREQQSSLKRRTTFHEKSGIPS